MQEFNEEDKVKLETLQQGLKSRYLKPGYLAPADFEGTILGSVSVYGATVGSDVDLKWQCSSRQAVSLQMPAKIAG